MTRGFVITKKWHHQLKIIFKGSHQEVTLWYHTICIYNWNCTAARAWVMCSEFFRLSAGLSGCVWLSTSQRRVQTHPRKRHETKKISEHFTNASATSCSFVCVYCDALHIRKCTLFSKIVLFLCFFLSISFYVSFLGSFFSVDIVLFEWSIIEICLLELFWYFSI